MLSRQGHVFISQQGKNIIPTSSQQRKKEKKVLGLMLPRGGPTKRLW